MERYKIFCLTIMLVSAIFLFTNCNKKKTNADCLYGEQKDIQTSLETFEINYGNQKHVLWITNNSKYYFSGTLRITIFSKDSGEILAQKEFAVKNLGSSLKTYELIYSGISTSYNHKIEWFSSCFTHNIPINDEMNDKHYKLIKSQKKIIKNQENYIEIYVLNKNFNLDEIQKSIKKKKLDYGILYTAIFVDDIKYAYFPDNPISGEFFDKDQANHVVGIFENNFLKGENNFLTFSK